MDSFKQYVSQYNTPRKVIPFLIGALLLISLIGYSFSQLSTQENTDSEQDSDIVSVQADLATHTLVYGTWSSESSLINAYDLMSGKEFRIAELPSTIKKVTVLDSERLLYINDTDLRDHGQDLSVYTLQTQASTPTVLAADSFGIDDYVVSPNKQYVATWEVQVSSESGVLLGGRSRVYTANLANPSEKHLIYDEVATETTPVHYPRAILDDGTVFMDTFLPNSGAGWAYGMSVSNFTGTTKEDLANMQNGTYGTQPVLSPDGQFLAFAGYEGSSASGVAEIDGFRRALVTPNTIELLNTKTRERTKLIGLSNQNTYSNIGWDDGINDIVYTQISSDANSSGPYIYSLDSQQTRAVSPQHSEYALISSLKPNKLLLGKQNTNNSVLGNLGSVYASPLTDLAVAEENSDTLTPLNESANLIQYITLVPTAYFTPETIPNSDGIPGKTENPLQLGEFNIKPTLAPVREEQQSERPRRRSSGGGSRGDLGSMLPNGDGDGPQSNVPTDKPACSDITWSKCSAKGKPSGTEEGAKCYKETNNDVRSKGKADGSCYASPLYFYGEPGQQVSVKVHTPLFNSNAPYSDGYAVTLLSDGNLSVNGKTVESIDYDYTAALRRVITPKKGVITTKENLEKTLNEFSSKLRLNTKEKQDLVNYGKKNVASPYVFVSFFDHETSHAILPITFDPQPDVYRNIVFYFKQLPFHPGFTPDLPHFEKIERKGFTAVEISGIVE